MCVPPHASCLFRCSAAADLSSWQSDISLSSVKARGKMYCKVARFEVPADSSLPACGAMLLVSGFRRFEGT